jgi:hypothetical protein
MHCMFGCALPGSLGACKYTVPYKKNLVPRKCQVQGRGVLERFAEGSLRRFRCRTEQLHPREVSNVVHELIQYRRSLHIMARCHDPEVRLAVAMVAVSRVSTRASKQISSAVEIQSYVQDYPETTKTFLDQRKPE